MSMDAQRFKDGQSRRRRRRNGGVEAPAPVEPVLIAARAPNSPLAVVRTPKRMVAASAKPQRQKDVTGARAAEYEGRVRGAEPAPRREARIVELRPVENDRGTQDRDRLLDRLLHAEGRGAISRAAEALRTNGIAFPTTQVIQLKLLEHVDEELVFGAIETISRLLARETIQQRPVLEQRLRRLEDYAEEPKVRAAAAHLRRSL